MVLKIYFQYVISLRAMILFKIFFLIVKIPLPYLYEDALAIRLQVALTNKF